MSFECKGKRLVYSGDTEPNPALRRLAEGADMLLCEATLTEDRRAPGHCVGADVGRLAIEAQVRQLLITHLETRFPVRRNMCEVQKSFPAAIEVQEKTSYEV
jgi:ribonuclease BN (tRNA processing enzyme)